MKPQSAAPERLEEAPSETVGSAADSLDSLACAGLDQLTEQLPSVVIPTPDLLETPEEEAAGDALAQVSIHFISGQI